MKEGLTLKEIIEDFESVEKRLWTTDQVIVFLKKYEKRLR